MITGSLCLTEILISRKSCSSKSDASPQGGLGERLGGRLAVLLQQSGVQRTRVHTDPDRRAVVLRGARDLLDLVVELLDVAGVHANRRAARLDRGEDVLRLEVDVRDHRDLRLAGDRRERVGVVLRRAGHADDLAAGRGQLGDLLERGRRCPTYGWSSWTAPTPARRRRPRRCRPGSAGSCDARRAGSERTECREKSQSSAVQPQVVDQGPGPESAGSRLRDYVNRTGPSTSRR